MNCNSIFLNTKKFPSLPKIFHVAPLLFLFTFIFFSLGSRVEAQSVNPATAFNLANPDKRMSCIPSGTRTSRTWNCSTIDINNPNQTIGEQDNVLLDKDGNQTCPTNQDLKNGKCVDKPSVGLCGAGGFTVANCLTSLADFIVGWIFRIINWILSGVLAFTSWLLDIVVYMTVVKFRSNFSDLNLQVEGNLSTGSWFGYSASTGTLSSGSIGSGLGIAGSGSQNLIYYLWGILRDLINVILLITIVYSAVRVMFDGFEEHRKRFIYLLLFSIVVNFSLLLVKVSIDVSNILALQAYTLAAKPVGFDTWENFRKRVQSENGQPTPSNLGEFVMNSFNFAQLNKTNLLTNAAKERLNEGTRVSWVFEVGQAAVYVGMIYLMFFMIGILVMRAAAFVFAMILAAFLAADMFFKMTEFGGGSMGKELGETFQKVSANIRDDFIDALVKGPVLFLFIFLVGVLANAIFTQGVLAEINSITTNAGTTSEFGALSGGAFVQSLGIFLKFALFFALVDFMFKKLNVVKFKSERMGKYSMKGINYATRALGLGSRGLGYLGQNTIGRYASNKNSLLGRGLNNLNNAQWVQNWKNADGGTVGGRMRRIIGGAVVGSVKGIKEGKYDLVKSTQNAGKLIDKKVGGRLGKGISLVTAGMTDNSDFGEGIKTAFAERDTAAQDKRQKQRDSEIEAAGTGVVTTSDHVAVASDGVKIKGAGNVSLSNLEKVMDGSFVGPMRPAEKAAADAFITRYNAGDAKALLEMNDARESASKKADQLAAAESEKMQGKISEEYLKGTRKAETFMGMVKDVGSLRGLGDQQEELKVGTASKLKKESQAEAKKFPVVNLVKQDLDSALKEVNKALGLESSIMVDVATAYTPNSDEYKKYEKIFEELKKTKTGIESDIKKIGIKSGNVSEDERVEIVEKFAKDKDLRGAVIKNKNTASDLLSTLFDGGSTNKVVLESIKKQRDEALVDLETLKIPEEKTALLASGVSTREYAKRVQAADAQYQKLNKIMSDSFKNAQELTTKAKKNEEAIKTQFDPKSADKKEEKH